MNNNSVLSAIKSHPIRVAVVDDHRIIIEGLEKSIFESDMTRLVWKACTCAECLKLLENEQPDVLMLDVGLPDGSGMDLCSKIKSKYPAVNILILTGYSEYTVISHAINNGASGYILKNATSDEVLDGIRTVVTGKRFLCEEANSILKKERNKQITLTRQERELLKHLAAGHTSKEIAEKMCLGYETVRSYRKNLQTKLGVHSTVELTRIALDQKLV